MNITYYQMTISTISTELFVMYWSERLFYRRVYWRQGFESPPEKFFFLFLIN